MCLFGCGTVPHFPEMTVEMYQCVSAVGVGRMNVYECGCEGKNECASVRRERTVVESEGVKYWWVE